MTKEEVLEIIRDENLRYYNWFEDHAITSDEVGIREHNKKWTVYSSDERATPIGELEFESESDALENFIKRLKAKNRYRRGTSYEY